MNLFLKKACVVVALVAACFLTVLFVGGGFLHEQLHHHSSQIEIDDCPLTLLAAQVLIFVLGVLLIQPVVHACPRIGSFFEVLLNTWSAYLNPRAPPATLL